MISEPDPFSKAKTKKWSLRESLLAAKHGGWAHSEVAKTTLGNASPPAACAAGGLGLAYEYESV
jgi:hypothetical protein